MIVIRIHNWFLDCNHMLNWFWYYFLSIIAWMLLICQYDASARDYLSRHVTALVTMWLVSIYVFLLILENVLMFDPQLLVQIWDYSSNIYMWDPHLTLLGFAAYLTIHEIFIWFYWDLLCGSFLYMCSISRKCFNVWSSIACPVLWL
jgi:hypothetical protein